MKTGADARNFLAKGAAWKSFIPLQKVKEKTDFQRVFGH